MWFTPQVTCCRFPGCPSILPTPVWSSFAPISLRPCGLAAPQVGVSAQALCVDVSAHPKARTTHGLVVLVNAEIVEASRNEKGREGCMSVPDLTGDVKRATKITVAGLLPLSGERVLITTDAFEARALQHEIDHCEGMLFLDRVVGAHAVYARKLYLQPPDAAGS
jgi:peptide deformylase